MHATYYAGECLGAVTQHIYIGIDNGLGKAGAATMYHDSTVCFLSTKGFHNGSPNLAQSAQLSDFHKEVCALVEGKIQGSCNVLQLQAAFLHCTNVFYCFSKGISNLLYSISATVSEGITLQEYSAQLRCISTGIFNGFSHFIVQCGQRSSGFALLNQLAQRISADNATHALDFLASSLQRSNGQGQHTLSTGTCVHHQRIFSQVKAV